MSWIPLSSFRHSDAVPAENGCRISSSIPFLQLTHDSVSLYNIVCGFPFATELVEEEAVGYWSTDDSDEENSSSGEPGRPSPDNGMRQEVTRFEETELNICQPTVGSGDEEAGVHSSEKVELLLATTVDAVFLFNDELSLLATLAVPVPRPVFRNVHLDRLSMVEYLPEMSCALVADQSSCFVSVIRISSSFGGSFAMELQCLIPSNPQSHEFSRARVAGAFPLAALQSCPFATATLASVALGADKTGLAVQKRTGELGRESFDVFVTYSNGHVLLCNLSDAIEVQLAKSLYADLV